MVQVSPEGETLESWNYEEAGLTPWLHGLLDHFGGIAGHVAGNVLCLDVLDWSDADAGLVCFRLDTGEIETLSWQELEAMEDTGRPYPTWEVTATETGALFTRGEEALELPVPAVGTEARLLGELAVFPFPGRVFLRDGTELLPPEEGELYRSAWVYSLAGLPDPPEEGELVCLYRGSCTSFLRRDGSILEQAYRQDSVDYEDASSWSIFQGVLGIEELNKASYYDIETGECIFRIPFNYEVD